MSNEYLDAYNSMISGGTQAPARPSYHQQPGTAMGGGFAVGGQGPSSEGEFGKGFGRSFAEIPGLLAGLGAYAADVVGADKARDAMLQFAKDREDYVQQQYGSENASFSDVLSGKADAVGFLKNASGYVTGQALQSIITGGVGAGIVKAMAKKGIVDASEKFAAEQLAKGATAEAAKKATEDFMKAQAAKAGFAGFNVGAGAQNLTMEIGSIYPEAVEQARQEGRELDAGDLARVGLAGAGAAAVDTAMERVSLGRVMGGSKASGNIAGRAAREIPAGMARESATEGIQTELERYGAGKSLTDADAMRDVIDSMAVGAIGGGQAGALASLRKAQVPPELQHVADKAAEGNSPLSKAAMAGNAGVLNQAATQPGPAPAQSEQDPISARVAAVVNELETTDTLQKLRALGPQMGAENLTNDFLYALQVARNPNSRPDQREAAINQVEQAIEWTKTGFTPATPEQPGTALAVRPANAVAPADLNGQFFDPNTIDGEAVRVDNMLPGPKALPGPQRGLTTQESVAQKQQAPSFVPDEQQNVAPANTAAAPAAGPTVQQTAAQAGVAGMTEVQAPRVETPAGAGPAVLRKRKAVVQQLAENGFETVQRDGRDFWMVNTKTGQKFKLDGPADAQLARKAINDRIDALAHTAAASPKNDLKEPTKAQIEAGNYKKSDVIELNGMKIKIENPQGSIRRGVGADGKAWETKMAHHYGEFQGTVGADGDKLDVFLGPRKDSDKVYVIDQVNPDGSFDEHKVMMGFTTEADARQGYLANYDKGWTGLGAITEMSPDEFKTWAKSRAAKKPLSPAIGTKPAAQSKPLESAAAAGQEQFTEAEKAEDSKPEFTYVTDEKGRHKLRITKPGELLKKAAGERKGKYRELTQGEAKTLEMVAALLNRRVVFFDPDGNFTTDGFVRVGDPSTIYIKTRTSINPLAVFGHEFFHTLRETNPQAWDAVSAVVASKVGNSGAKRFRADRYGDAIAEQRGNTELSRDNGGELEELVSDLGGNLLKDSKFWKEVFDKINRDNGAEAKGIIAKLSAAIQSAITRMVNGLKQRGFAADSFVKDLDQVRAAFVDAMAQHLKDTKLEERAKPAEGKVKKSDERPEGLTVEGYHFSKAPRQVLNSAMYGTGLKGSAREEIMEHGDERLKHRISFYVNKGTGINPEAGVGGVAHKATLTNVYDADADPLRLRSGNARDFESKVLDAGYDGYLTRMEGTQSGQVIMLGKRTIKPEVLGPATKIDNAKVVPAPVAREQDAADRLMANKALPSGMLSPQRWSEVLMSADPELAAQLLDIGALEGNQPMFKDELAGKVRKLSGAIKASAERARAEYDEVVAKYKDTEQWLKAPNGSATNLSKRQWVQVRTPSFKKWFGDWEKHARAENPVGSLWSDDTVSKAVDANGEPLVVYHGTDKGGFTEFEQPGGSGRGDLGIWTTPNYGMARSYVRKGRARDVELPDIPRNQEDLEDSGYSFYENDDGTVEMTDPNGYNQGQFDSMDEAVAYALDNLEVADAAGEQPGIYALFIDVKNPNEDNFEGALWNGERVGQYQVRDKNDEPIYGDNGSAYFDSFDEANQVALANPGAEVQPADSHYNTTDDVVSEARRYKNDGAIIREVVDDGGGVGYNMEPSDIFVVFDPRQVKSADYNNGEFSDNTDDLRKSKEREYKLDIERENRAVSKSARLAPEELKAIEDDGEKLGLNAKQIKQLVADARAIKKQYPTAAGWAPIEVTGVTAKFDDEGNLKTNDDGSPQVEVKFNEQAYAFNRPIGAKRAPVKMDQAWMKKVADKFYDLVTGIYSRADKGDKNAQIIISHQTWYRNVAEVLRREYGAQGDFLADLLGATSPNTPVDTNWRFSIDIMRRFVRGEFDADMQKFVEYLDQGGAPSKYPAAAKIRQISGKLYGMNSGNAMVAMADMWRVIEPGTAPKARNFALNLIGQSNMATIDVWAARMLRRAANMVRGADLPRIPPVAEKGVTGKWNADATEVTGEFGFGAAVMERVSKMLEKKGIKVTPPDLQAIAWFAEKELWGQKGWTTKTGEGGSFEENIEAFPVERYLAGWSIQQGEKVPEQGQVSVAQARVMSVLIGDDTVVAARVLPTSGLYGGTIEASFDTEWTAVKGQHDPSMALAEIARLAKENEQYDIFVSRVVGPKEDNPNARPGVEIYFKDKQSLQQAMPILEKFTSRGVDGFTMAVDPRAKPKGVSGEQFIGVRLQYVPEISMRWDDQARKELLAEGGIEKALQEKEDLLANIAEEVRRMDGVAFAAMQKYDTVVVGKENYDEYIDRIAEGADRTPGGQAWFGQPIRQGLEGAATRLRGDVGQDGTRGVPDASGAIRASAERDTGDGSGRDQGRSLAPLPGAPVIRGATGPDPRLVEVAERYARDNGITLGRQAEYVKVDPQRAARIAAAYEAMPHAPQDPKVKEAYENLIQQTIAQYRALEAAGYRFYLHDETNDPYQGNPWNAMRDLRANQVMGVFATEAGFGTNENFDPANNPLLADTGIRWPYGSLDGKPKRVLANDLFRAVHDAFGHGLEGAGFRADGEENAWQAHIRMFTGSAKGAITSETRGQNSWLNYGPYGEKNRTAKVEDTVFADQKTGLMPEWTWSEGLVDDMPEKTAEPTYNQRIQALKDLISCLK